MNIKTSTPTRYTPGPYCIRIDRDGCDDVLFIVASGSERYIAGLNYWADDEGGIPEELEADARLLACAPEMPDILNRILSCLGRLPSWAIGTGLRCAVSDAREVLARAEWRE